MHAQAALVFTAIVTPFEVALVADVATLFLANRIIDGVFFIDLLVQFVLVFESSAPGDMGVGATWVSEPVAIRRNYLRGWFGLDLVSLLVSIFDIGAYLGWYGNDAPSSDAAASGGQPLAALKMLRALRLIKLIRLVRASRMYRRWETRVALSYTTMSLIGCSVSITIISHWFACMWVLQTTFSAGSLADTWLGAMELVAFALARHESSESGLQIHPRGGPAVA